MPVFAATDWTVAAATDLKRFKHAQYKRVARIVLTTASDMAYPTTGIPWPNAKTLGFKNRLDTVMAMTVLTPTGGIGAGHIWNSDPIAKTFPVNMLSTTSDGVQTFANAPTTTGAIPGGTVLYVEAHGW